MTALEFFQIKTLAEKHLAIAISYPRPSSHSFSGSCVDVFFDDPLFLVSFQSEIESRISHFVAVSYETDYCYCRVPHFSYPY